MNAGLCCSEQQYMVYMYIVNFNLDKNDNVRQIVTPKKNIGRRSLANKINIYHVIITINVWKPVFIIVSYQPAPRMKPPGHKVVSLYVGVPKPKRRMIYRCLITEAKNGEKLVLKCHEEDHFSQQWAFLMYCGVEELTYCSILVICMPLTLHAECFHLFIYMWACTVEMILFFVSIYSSVRMLLTLNANSVWGSVYKLLGHITPSTVNM